MITENMGLESTFVPEFNGNKDLPADEQVQVIYRTPTLFMGRRLAPKPEVKFDYDATGNVKGGQVSLVSDNKPLIDGMLIRIKHLAWRDEKQVEHQVTDVKSLYEAPVQYSALADEIGNFFREELQKKLPEKN